jgi:hypothetical protein
MTTDLSLGDGVGRGALRGAAIGLVGVAGTAIPTGILGGLETIDAVAIGAFAAVWAGPGFGALFGAIRAIARNDRAAIAERAELGPADRG